MGNQRRVASKTTTPRPGGVGSKPNKRSTGVSVSKGKKNGKGKEIAVGDTYDVYNASDNDLEDKRVERRSKLENVAVRDYEIENIDSEDDEEIDSDDAFDESDEERFGGYKFGGASGSAGPSNRKTDRSRKPSVRFADDDNDESMEEEEAEEDDENMVDLSEMLDANDSDDDDDTGASHEAKDKQPQSEGFSAGAIKLGLEDMDASTDSEASDSEDNDAFEGMQSSGSDESSEDDDAERLSKLGSYVSSISARAPKRRFVDEAGGGFAEDEHAVGTRLSTKGVSLGISDLLGSLGDVGSEAISHKDGEAKTAREMRALRDKVHNMEKAARKAGSGVVSAPVPKRLQDQMDRKVAYTQTKKDVSEWQPTVDANRNAEHLSFPMNAPGKVAPTSGTLAQDSGPTNDMERQIQSVLEQSGMTDEQQRQYEELELKALTPEEVRNRQRELRLMRELMFRSEQKAKRMAKIKSKAYRRILKKDKVRAQDKAMEKLKEEDPEMYAMVIEKMTMSRAEERMTLRHKNTSKWAREMSKRSHGDDDTQRALREQLDQHDALKRKIYDLGSDEDLSDYEAGKEGFSGALESDGDDDASFAAVKDRASRRIAAEMDGLDPELPDDAPHKSLFDMKFMRNAMERKREQTMQDAQMMRDEFDSLDADIDEDGNLLRLKKQPKGTAPGDADSSTAPGRKSFSGGLKKRETEGNADGDEGDDSSFKRVKLNDAGQIGQVASATGHRARVDGPMSVDDKRPAENNNKSTRGGVSNGKRDELPVADNPWVSSGAVDMGLSHRGGKSTGLTKDSTKIDKLSAKLREKRISNGAAGVRSEDNVLVDVNMTLDIDQPHVQDDSADESDDGIKLESVGNKKRLANPNAFTQRELVEQAFAEDDMVEAEFSAEKDAIMEEEAPKDQDLTLPGWGSWCGTGIAPKKSKIIRKAPDGSGIEKKNRVDSQMGSVIISQKQLKAANKYYSNNVPFPYYTADQYEETLQVPLGKEWNTTKSYSKMIKPRILTKAGRIIDPLSIPSKKKQ
ncbi:hypothetical protein EV175_000171 [Coemansia sp. RSA 1933]|nr:hypothetical protein EV175_000171 [Coemansia sp. RSA 1933]